MKKYLFILLAVLFFTSGCYTQYKLTYEIDRTYPEESSKYYSWYGQENINNTLKRDTTKQTSNNNFKSTPVRKNVDIINIKYKSYETEDWYKINNLKKNDRKYWFKGHSIWEPTYYSPWYGNNRWSCNSSLYNFYSFHGRCNIANISHYNSWNFFYWNNYRPINKIVYIDNKVNKPTYNKPRTGGFGSTDYNKPNRDYLDNIKNTRSGSNQGIKITLPRSTGRSAGTVKVPTTRSTGRSNTVRPSGGSSNTRSTGRTATKKTKT